MANAAFVKQYIVASLGAPPMGIPSDDCMATMQAFSDQFLENQIQLEPGPVLANSSNFGYQFLSGFCRILELPIDYSSNAQHLHIQLLAKPYLQRMLSAQATLGYSGEYNPRPLSTMVAYTILNLRYIACNFATVLSGKKPAESELRNPGMA